MRKICRDCRYCSGHDTGPQCYHPLALKAVDIVNGTEDRRTAREMRADVKLCGAEAHLFSDPDPSWFSRLRQAIWPRPAMSASQ